VNTQLFPAHGFCLKDTVKETKWRLSIDSDTGPYLGLGIQLAAGILVFFFIGKWADGKLDTAPWLMLAGVMIGVVGGLIKFYLTVADLDKKEQAKKANEVK
jgi:ATP synthase protein I